MSDKKLWEMLVATEKERDALRAELDARTAKQTDEFWYWQRDGDNYLESLVCPVLISAADLRGLVMLTVPSSPDAHELWAAAQLIPGESIEDGVSRIEALLAAAKEEK